MKTFKGLSFGMSVVNAGQRAVSEEPELVATSTNGGFRVSSSVTRAMGVGHGEYIMFIKNVDEVQEAINAQVEEFVAELRKTAQNRRRSNLCHPDGPTTEPQQHLGGYEEAVPCCRCKIK